ncbi:TIGR02301 family protein [Gellertiella hungarica]|uniref:Uncharacterized protein (TIGR02301 family) n=1 Tax=Gellertiella hungarica TaxID=1572859 RepID=A0A7W6J813_9HYPH|nr:TIGR02301 family protein [Gellertiella hungarica]MBB4065586.1 uncharacterized protein (TIGR02301 family) [Gellertiella hungarica]
MKGRHVALCLGAALVLLPPALAAAAAGAAKPGAKTAETQPAPAPPPPPPQAAPYDRDLLRLAEIMGSLHYLRGLCNPDEKDQWRAKMQKLIDLEAGKEADRRQKLTAAFNRGYRSFAALHATCTGAALEAEERYRAEGATLATEITARFGN